MHPLASIHDRCQRLIVAAVLFVSVMCSTSRALATCGDYLLHNPINLSSLAGQQASSPLAWQSSLASHPTHPNFASLSFATDVQLHNFPWATSDSLAHSQNRPPKPTSPCAGGRCQSTPPPSPINHPSRAVYLKQNASLDRIATSKPSDDASSWAIPFDGSFPANPTQTVDVPPPERAYAHA